MDISSIQSPIANLTAAVPASLPAAGTEDRRALIQAVHAVNEARVFGQENELSFLIDRATRRSVVRIVDRQTKEVVQQIPSEQVLRLAEELQQQG